MKFLADDGTVFDRVADCLRYEKKQKDKEKQESSTLYVDFFGIVSKDAEMKFDKERNNYVMTFCAAESYASKTGGHKTIFYIVEYVGRKAKRIAPFITKGKRVKVTGEVKTETYIHNGNIFPCMKVINSDVRLVGELKNNEENPF